MEKKNIMRGLVALMVFVSFAYVITAGTDDNPFKCEGKITLNTRGKVTNQYIGNCPLGNEIKVIWEVDKDSYNLAKSQFNYTFSLLFDKKCMQGMVKSWRTVKFEEGKECDAMKKDIQLTFGKEFQKKSTNPKKKIRKSNKFGGWLKNG